MNESRPLAPGDVVLVEFPFVDRGQSKVRPAVVVGRAEGRDVIPAFITSRVVEPTTPAGVRVSPNHPEFEAVGLKPPD